MSGRRSLITDRNSSVVERPLADREVVGSIPSRVIPKNLKMVVMDSLLGAHGLGVSITTTGPHSAVVITSACGAGDRGSIPVGSSIPGRVKPKTLKLVVMASLLGAQD